MYYPKQIRLKIYLLILAMSAAAVTAVSADEQDYYFRLKKNWQYMQRVYENVNQYYVEEVDPQPLIQAGINGMLEKLDPYTVFIEEDGERRLQIITTGKYGGLGMEVGLRGKNIVVISPVENSPAKRQGILAGDIIEKIDGQSIIGWSIDKVSSRLRGKIGSEVSLVLRRHGIDKPFELKLTREEIVIEDVDYFSFIELGVAYVSLTGFSDKAITELRNAISELKKQGEIQAFLLDLRGNPGGLLDAAVQVVNVFVDKGELVVFTKGFREGEFKFYTEESPLLPNVPLVVLVDGGSASASEIVAGSLQDLDRAVILGEPTFGKGLVQKVYNIDKAQDVKLKITTAKYYVPSGRCIQKRDYAHENGVVIHDSSASEEGMMSHAFYTRNKRPVYDKGGILPDVQVPGDSISYVLLELIRKNKIFDFAVDFYYKNPKWNGVRTISDSILNEFNRFLKDQHFDYEPEFSKELDQIQSIAKNKHYSRDVFLTIEQLRQQLLAGKATDYENNKDQIRRYIQLELTEKYFGKKERNRLNLENDGQISEALLILENLKRYNKLLATQ
jgi:carboxyl-terminal processing protease